MGWSNNPIERVGKVVSLKFIKETDKDVFRLVTSVRQRRNSDPREESNLPLWTEGLRFEYSWELRTFPVPRS